MHYGGCGGGYGNQPKKQPVRNIYTELIAEKENRLDRRRLNSANNYLRVAQPGPRVRSKSDAERPVFGQIGIGNQNNILQQRPATNDVSEVYERFMLDVDNRTSTIIQPQRQQKKTLQRRSSPLPVTTGGDIFAPDPSFVTYINAIVHWKFKEDNLHMSQVYNNPSRVLEYRNNLVIWLYKAKQTLHLTNSMFYSVVRLFDYFITFKYQKNDLRLLLLTLCWMVTKMDSVKQISVNEIIRLGDMQFGKQEVFSLERKLFGMLGFRIMLHDPEVFIAYYLHHLKIAPSHILTYATHFIVETFGVSQHFSSHQPSKIAAAAVYLATMTFYPQVRIYERMYELVGYYSPPNMSQLIVFLTQELKTYLNSGCPHSVIFMKYRTPDMKNVSDLLIKGLFRTVP